MTAVLTVERLFDGTALRSDMAVVLEDGRISEIRPAAGLPRGTERRNLGPGVLAPGFVDLQVNGGGGRMLNADPTPETVAAIAAAHARFGTTALLPTVITDHPSVTAAAIRAVRAARAAGTPGLLGIHVEGPFIDPRRCGAHPEEHVRAMTEADFALLAPEPGETVLVTLAPDRVPPSAIARLTAAGVVVLLGHSDASAAAARAALAAGARGFTHLYNAMSPLRHREPGMVGAALADRESWVTIIADGQHVDPIALEVAISAKGAGRVCLISDAMPPAAGGPDRFRIGGGTARRRNGRLELDDGTLAGADLTMDAAVRYCVAALGLDLADALRMATADPAALIGRDGEAGRIAPGRRADMVHLGPNLDVRATWIAGEPVRAQGSPDPGTSGATTKLT